MRLARRPQGPLDPPATSGPPEHPLYFVARAAGQHLRHLPLLGPGRWFIEAQALGMRWDASGSEVRFDPAGCRWRFAHASYGVHAGAEALGRAHEALRQVMLACLAPRPTLTDKSFAAYVEDFPQLRLEMIGGRIFAMAGATHAHGVVMGSTTAELDTRLDCQVIPADEYVWQPEVAHRGTWVFPDITVVCGEARFKDIPGAPPLLENPTMVVEILSDSTSERDQTEKVDIYGAIPSILHYLILDPQERTVVHYRREGKRLVKTPVGLDGSLTLLGKVFDSSRFFRKLPAV